VSHAGAIKKLLGHHSVFVFYGIEILGRLFLATVSFALPMHVLTADVGIYWNRAHDISPQHLPYRDFVWEYPPLTILPLLYMPLVNGSKALFYLLFVLTTVTCEYTSLCLLRGSYRERRMDITLFWSVTVLPLAMLAYFRFDFISVLFATMALVAMERRGSTVLPIFLGFFTKLWPVFLVVTLFAKRRFRETGLAIGACVLGTLVWWSLVPEGFRTFLQFRQGDGFQIESIPGSILMLAGRNFSYGFGALNVSDAGLKWVQTIMTLATVLGPALIGFAALRTKSRNDVALTAGVIAFELCASRLVSPQFITWLAPFVACLWPRERNLGFIYGLLVALTMLVLAFYHSLIHYGTGAVLIVIARNAVLVWFTVALLRRAFETSRDGSPIQSGCT